ncbi:peptidase U32 family protein [Butyrivibrio sp. AE3004]|uniref:peptidase U32 family protein n=1 Tax=Butyrivibrio sp. AE3004 TaxID=1506994 RepID=UPI00068B016C|nr:U32 family peptidase [Butyrivibrio sp. AE3004]
MRKVELLSPAGNYETMVGAFNAGADAVYLGGQGFGARAFADNFSNEEVIQAIKYAHMHGKKIYLTVNTLLKENEIPEFKAFFAPFAEAGLDGAIIQDFGVFRIIRENFPSVELHVSTQMTITGKGGANLLMDLGAKRVVPARELSLQEIEDIHNNCKFQNGESVEIEAFIHGAMCYCYSGACLFSSMVGERSGNRGRCAQPCRLPYKNGKRECYPLSLKDMCMVDRIPELIEAGIDSFKIEGRMKKPEYAAGVTSIYRKYIDKYYELAENDKEFKKGKIKLEASSEDKRLLSFLYLRSEIGEGYYFRHNSPDMVTIDNPAYNGSDDNVLSDIRNRYLTGEKKVKISASGKFKIGQPAEFKLAIFDNTRPDNNIQITAFSDNVQEAVKKPMTEDDINKQLSKFGNTFFELRDITLEMDEKGIFIPNKSLNELRRDACDKLEKAIEEFASNNVQDNFYSNENTGYFNKALSGIEEDKPDFSVTVMDSKQLKATADHIRKSDKRYRIYVDSRILFNDSDLLKDIPQNACVYVALPYVLRNETFIDGHSEIGDILEKTSEYNLKGILVRNLEELFVIKKAGYKGDVIPDYGLYMWNHEAFSLYNELFKEHKLSGFNLPLELNIHEMGEFLDALYNNFDADAKSKLPEAGIMVYGRVPMMISAGCIKNTLESCTGKRGKITEYGETNIVDRTGRVLPVTYDCRHCSNIIWNSVPVSLFKKTKKLIAFAHKYNVVYRIDFTTESEKEVSEILKAYGVILCDNKDTGKMKYDELLSTKEYTAGHFERSAD